MDDVARRIAERRIVLAASTLDEAATLIEQQRWRGALNRLYYAAFYAARALLATRDLEAAKHSGVIALFQQHFVKTAMVDPQIARALPQTFEARVAGDYDDTSDPTEDQVRCARDDVERFVAECRTVLERLIASSEQS